MLILTVKRYAGSFFATTAKEAEEDACEYKSRILEAMGPHHLARLPDGSTIRRRVVKVPAAPRAGYSYEGFYPKWADGKDGE